jgi:20S proteasome subunit beta 1
MGAMDNTSDSGAVKTGTTIMAVEFNGGVMLAADSRTSTGDYVANRASRKVSRLHERIFVLRSGSAADTQALTAMVRNYLNQHAIELGSGADNHEMELPSVNTAANLFKLSAYNNKDNLMAGLIVAGWDKHKGPQVYTIPLGGTRLRTPCAIGGSGSGYITALVDHLYRPNMTETECRDFVTRCVSHAMARDGSSGGVIRVVTVKPSDVKEEIVYGDSLPFQLSQTQA